MSCVTQSILNIAAYKFVSLDGLVERRKQLLRICRDLELFGTILLSSEGINLFLAGPEERVRQFVQTLRSDPAFADIEPKESFSDTVPFRRILVRLKKEIISLGVPSVQPAVRTSPKLPARELKRWLDEGRPVRLLDTRNDYEVDLGTFAGAEHLSIGHFRQFPEAIGQLPEQAKEEPLVMFCTGGIRCEKAGPLMEQAGFKHVYQLDGGILKYFEECGGAHYTGACFVFDNRVALSPDLQPTGNLLCYACQAILSSEDVTSDKYRFGEYCPHCYRTPIEQATMRLQARELRIRELAAAQPGCTPYCNTRAIHVARRFAGWTMIDFLDAYQPAIGRQQWLEWLRAGLIVERPRSIDKTTGCTEMAGSSPAKPWLDEAVATAERIVREGERFVQFMPNTVEPAINPDIQLVHEDEWLVVVNKPAPLPTHPSGRFNRNSLLHLVAPAYPNEKLRAAHRLDSETSGIVLLCRKHQAARFVQPQFAEEQVAKVYLARVHGHPAWESTICQRSIGDEAIAGGGRSLSEQGGLPAETRFQVLERLQDGTTLLEARPVTGRTHQIRLHLQALGHSIVGDRLYGEDAVHAEGSTSGGEESTSGSSEQGYQAMCLHALSLTFTHPATRERVTYHVPSPDWGKAG